MDTIDQKADKFIDWLDREFSVNSADYPKIREGLVLILKSQERDTKQAPALSEASILEALDEIKEMRGDSDNLLSINPTKAFFVPGRGSA
jgi:hypothetical protein